MAKLRGHQIKFSDIMESEAFKSYKRRIIFDAKKEVFDDIAKMPLYVVTKGKKIKYIDVGEADWFEEIKKRHLSTSQSEGTE